MKSGDRYEKYILMAKNNKNLDLTVHGTGKIGQGVISNIETKVSELKYQS